MAYEVDEETGEVMKCNKNGSTIATITPAIVKTTISLAIKSCTLAFVN